MKKIIVLTLAFAFCYTAKAQSTLTIPYQALVRDAYGNPLANKQIGAEISLLLDNINGTVIFTETHNPTTNQFGQMDLQIGSVDTNNFDAIDWSAGKMFIKLAVDLENGSNPQEIATHQLLAVPFAKYAEEAAGWKMNETGISFMDGNVGIGTTNSNSRLNVGNGNISEQAIHINASENSVLRFLRHGTVKWGIVDNLNSDKSLSFYNYRTNKSEITIDSLGNVGIGAVPSEYEKLNVNGNIRNYISIFYHNDTIFGYVGRGKTITGGWTWNNYPDLFTLTYDKIDFAIGGWAKNGGGFKGAALFINSDNGNVGIGTINPGSKKLYVNGPLYATNMKTSSFDFSSILKSIENQSNNSDGKSTKLEVIKTSDLQTFIENDSTIDLVKMNVFLLEKIDQLIKHNLQMQSEIENIKNK